jgi:hypothetical protein
MRTHRFGKKIKLPATIAIKHQLMKLMFEDSVKEAAVIARIEEIRRSSETTLPADFGRATSAISEKV